MHKSTKEKASLSEIDDLISRSFDIKKRLGRGAYGIVWRAIDRSTNKSVAVKKIFDAFRNETDAQRTFREIMFLRAFRSHPNIVQLYSVHRAANDMDIYLSFEHMESDLHNAIKRGNVLKDLHKRYIMYQLLNAILYMHSGNVIHRDLKPSNILVDSTCRCKIADFGLARSIARPKQQQQSPPSKLNSSSSSTVNSSLNSTNEEERLMQQAAPELTDYVATRWYRAPEILIASKRYTKGIDMWSMGCILGEMIRGRPLFPGSCTINQIERIVKAMPSAKEEELRAINAERGGGGNGDEAHFGSNFLVMFNEMLKTSNGGGQGKGEAKDSLFTLDQLLSEGPEDAVELTKKLLMLDPLRRLTAKEAIQHCYVERFRKPSAETELDKDVVPPFRDDIQLTVNEYRTKIYEIMSTHGTNVANKGVTNSGVGGRATQGGVGSFRTKTKKFMSASKASTTNGHEIMTEEKGHRISQLQDNCSSCPFERMSKSSTINYNKLEAEREEDARVSSYNNSKLQQHRQHGDHCGQTTYGQRMVAARNKVSCMPAVAEAANYKTLSKQQQNHSRIPPVELLGSTTGGVILPRSDDVHRMNLNNNNRNSSQYHRQTTLLKSDQQQERGGGRGRVMVGHNATETTTTTALPQRCYESRLKVLEEKIRRHKQEMTEFLRVGNNNKKLASIQAAAGNKPVQAVVMQNGRMGDGLMGGNGGRRIESKLSCSSSSSTSNQSLKQISQGSMDRKPAFRCGCKPSAAVASNGMLSRNAVGGGGMNGKLFAKPSSAVNAGFGVISATDLYKLRSSEIISHN